VLPGQLLDRHPGIGFSQNANDLRFGESLLYVRSPDYVIGR
jgi:hypothetical protein